MKCIYCGSENENDARFCQACGARLEAGEAAAAAAEEVKETAETVKTAGLQLEDSIDAHMAKMEVELEEEEDLSDVLTSHTGVQNIGNAQAQNVRPTIELVTPESTPKEKPKPTLVVPTTKTEELIAEKEKERQARQQRIEEYEREKARQEEARKAAQAKAQAERQTQNAQQAQAKPQVNNEKMTAIIGYITWIGFAAAFFMSGSERSEYMKKNLNRALILNLLSLLGRLPVVGGIISVVALVGWVLAIWYTATDSDKTLPFIDDIKIIQ